MPFIRKFATLAHMREQALISAGEAVDPLTAQQYQDLALCYGEAIDELRATGLTIVPQHDPATIPWRSVQLWTSNDR